MNITKIKKVRTDKNSEAWLKLCAYIEKVATDGNEEFWPSKYLGNELFSLIDTLPSSIEKLVQVRRMILYGSNIAMIPPEIGKMKSLEIFTPYTSYDLCWFPYEITHCPNLKDSTVSTRALYYNPKNKKPFPNLIDCPVRYDDNPISCSVCGNNIDNRFINQYWISLRVATDILPLLVNLCSYECGMKLPKPAERYPQSAHRGGRELKPISVSDWR